MEFNNKICLLKNAIQYYAWGSTTDIPQLTGMPNPDNKPWAEMWMGAHPKAPSQMEIKGKWHSLEAVITSHPVEMLGHKTAARFSNQLPYLFKVLAAGKPLSIQAHPSQTQAEKGFARENQLNIPLDAYNRNYKDPNHKPECICALSPFWALNGFRMIEELLYYFDTLCPDILKKPLAALTQKPDSQGLEFFFKALMNMDEDLKIRVVETAVRAAASMRTATDPAFDWMVRLYDAYQIDVGVLAPVLLNLVCLAPGQAMYLPAGQLHAYLDGLGIELMANSDNVLRGGLTPKHVDVPELMKVLNFSPTRLEILTPRAKQAGEGVFACDAAEFVLSTIRVDGQCNHVSAGDRSIEILLCTEGEVAFFSGNENRPVAVPKGASVVVPAAVPQYRIQGRGVLFKAAVPIN